jgi:hypothetical protein
MGRIDGTSRDNDRPTGVIDSFQVNKHSVDPTLANRCRNLLSHKDKGPAGTDESELVRPEIPFVREAFLRTGNGEGLAGRASGPERSVVRPTCESGRETPSADAGKEMALGIAPDIIGSDIDDRTLVNVSRSDVACCNKISKPLSGIRIPF